MVIQGPVQFSYSPGPLLRSSFQGFLFLRLLGASELRSLTTAWYVHVPKVLLWPVEWFWLGKVNQVNIHLNLPEVSSSLFNSPVNTFLRMWAASSGFLHAHKANRAEPRGASTEAGSPQHVYLLLFYLFSFFHNKQLHFIIKNMYLY